MDLDVLQETAVDPWKVSVGRSFIPLLVQPLHRKLKYREDPLKPSELKSGRV